jgi:hypothetical protein
MSEEKKEPDKETKAEEAQKPPAPAQAAPQESAAPAPEKKDAAAPQVQPAPAPSGAEAPKKEAPKKEKPANCAGCNKSIKKKRWYYRNGKFYCTKRCWTASTKKAENKEEAPAAS